MGLSHLKREILLFDDTLLIDATQSYPVLQAVLVERKIQVKEPHLPRWVDEVLFLAERLQRK